MLWHIQLSRALAFTRNPSDTDVSPATYTAEGASDLVLVDQQRDIAIDGSDGDDGIIVTDAALASKALYNYNVRGFEGDDFIEFEAALIQNSVINGNIGDDELIISDAILTGSYVLGGKDNDSIQINGITGGEVNGNLGNDSLVVADELGNTNASVRGGQGNDFIEVQGTLRNSAIYGDKGNDIIEVKDDLGTAFTGDHANLDIYGGEGADNITLSGGSFTNSAVYGDDGNDVIRNLIADDIELWGGAGNDVIFDINAGDSGVTIVGGEGNDEIETISLFGATSTVDAGVGADEVEMIGGFLAEETYVFDSGDSVAATKTSIAGAFLNAGDKITFGNGVDLLLGLGTEDFIDIDFKASSVQEIGPFEVFDPLLPPPGIAVVSGDSRFTPLTPGKIYEVSGDYNVGTGVFTVENRDLFGFGQDHLYIVGAANDTVQNVFNESDNMFITNQQLDVNQFI